MLPQTPVIYVESKTPNLRTLFVTCWCSQSRTNEAEYSIESLFFENCIMCIYCYKLFIQNSLSDYGHASLSDGQIHVNSEIEAPSATLEAAKREADRIVTSARLHLAWLSAGPQISGR